MRFVVKLYVYEGVVGGGEEKSYRGYISLQYSNGNTLVMDHAIIFLAPYETYFVINLMHRVQHKHLSLYSLIKGVLLIAL